MSVTRIPCAAWRMAHVRVDVPEVTEVVCEVCIAVLLKMAAFARHAKRVMRLVSRHRGAVLEGCPDVSAEKF